MDNINLKDILNGKLTKLPYELDINERYEFIHALADALGAIQREEFPDVSIEDYNLHVPAKLSVITDNFIVFMLNEDNEFSTELIIAAFIRAIRVNQVQFNSETDAFVVFYKGYQKWIVGAPDTDKGVYVGDGRWNKNWNPPTENKQIGGNFTLRDHHKNQ